ncbi:MAG TPA: ABC transporter permease, partial [Mucilaginibacter sp.]|nr:ABC transporter permease [Mucilaginibacter sp.]
MIKNYLKFAWRNLLKDRQFTILNLIGLSTGLACTFLIYLWVNDELQVDKFNKNDNRLYQAMLNIPVADGTQTQEYTPGLLAKSLADEIPEIESAVSVVPGYKTGILTAGDKHIKSKPEFVGNNYFNIFSYDIVQGNKNLVLSSKNDVLLSDELALRLFNTTGNIVGKTVKWEDDTSQYIVSGIFKKPLNATANFDILFNYQLYFDRDASNNMNWRNTNPLTYVILKQGSNITQVNNKIAGFIKSKNKKSTASLFLRKFSDKYLYDKYENGVQAGGRIAYVKLFSIIAVFILVIACINFMNLSTAKAARRLKEVGIKKVAGASRASLIFQYLGESMLMTFLSVTLAMVIVYVFLPHFNQITEKHLLLQFNRSLVLSVLGISFVTGLISGSYPAFYLSGFKPVTILKGKLNTSLSELWVRKGLVVFQFTLSVIFIVTVLVVYRQMQLIQSINLGYNKDNVISFKNEGQLNKNLQSFLTEVKNIPGIINASSFKGDLTGDHGRTEHLHWEGEIGDEKIEFASLDFNYGLMEMLGFKVAEGRSFSRAYGADSSKIIFNKTAIAAMGIKNPIGKTVKVWGGAYQIVGVVNDFHFESLYEKVKPCFMRLNQSGDNILVKIKGGNEKEAILRINNLYQAFNHGLPFEYKFLDDDYQALYTSEQRVATLSRYFAGLAIILSCLGLFGLSVFTAQKRQREIGIRKVVGASVSRIAIMLSADFLKLVFIA